MNRILEVKNMNIRILEWNKSHDLNISAIYAVESYKKQIWFG